MLATCALVLAATLGMMATGRAVAQEEAAPQEAGPAAEYRSAVTLLSDATQGFIAVNDLPRLLDQWTRTSLADLQHDEAMRNFFESQREKISRRIGQMGLQSGIRLSDLRDSVSGEVVLAWMRFDAPQRPLTVAMSADTRGREAQRDAMLSKVDQELRARNATVTRQAIEGHEATVYTLPQKKGQLVVDRLVILELDGRLMISDRAETIAGLVTTLAGSEPGGLSQSEDYQAVVEQTEAANAAGEGVDPAAPHVRWFARPIGMGRIARELAGVDRGRRVDILNLLRNQGFDALQAMGGQIQLATERYDLLHQGFVYAPPTVQGPERYRMAARILQFPNVQMDDPPAWVLPTAATFFQASWKMEEAFWAIETLVDEAMGDEVFRPMLEGIKEDPHGPQIDVENDIVAYFGEELYIVTDNIVTEDTTQERVVAAIRIEDAERVATVVNGAMEEEPYVSRFPYEGHVVWEVRPEEADAETFDVTGVDDFGFEIEAGAGDGDADQAEPLLDRWALTVYGEYFMFASHPEFLVQLIEHAEQGNPTIAQDPTYERVREAILHEGGDLRATQRVVQTDRAWRVKYELLREGRFLESDSLLATLIRRARERAERAENPEADPLEIDMSQLPPFAAIRQHLQPSGGYFKTQEQGWSMTHFLLRKEQPTDSGE